VEAGGDRFTRAAGMEIQNDPEWQTLAAWVKWTDAGGGK
jgi:hypothetical protein